jgi:hypothetical protein
MRFEVSPAYFERAKRPRLARDRKDEVDGGRLEISRHSHRNVHLLASFSLVRFHSKSLSTEVHILGSHFSVCQPITARSRYNSVTESVVLLT